MLAHIPVAMIFDDHDITDDWNLSREWEEIAYGHPFSRRIIGNALLAYAMNQAWGNCPEAFADEAARPRCSAPRGARRHAAPGLHRAPAGHSKAGTTAWPTTPPLVVIDTRTQRWRSERCRAAPRG